MAVTPWYHHPDHGHFTMIQSSYFNDLRAACDSLYRIVVLGRLKNAVVLVVDGHLESGRMLTALLRAEGAKVMFAQTVEAAQLLLDTVRPDLAIVELMLPGTSGLALLRTLGAQAAGKKPTTIAMTAGNGKALEDAARDAGAVAYVRKPIDTESFATLVASHWEGDS